VDGLLREKMALAGPDASLTFSPSPEAVAIREPCRVA
jgi:hypothetical protein